MSLLELVGTADQGKDEWWAEAWKGMPEYVEGDQRPYRTLEVRLPNHEALRAFEDRLNIRVRHNKWTWYPERTYHQWSKQVWVGGPGPAHPVYIVSKGRWSAQKTSISLHSMNVPHYVVVEGPERDLYEEYKTPSATILVLDPAFQRDYDTFDDLGDAKSKGPGPARNFAWEHSIAAGAAWHWVMDDNIENFYRYTSNIKRIVRTGAVLRAMENFCARYENVLMGGPHYEMFVYRIRPHPPFILNSRIYSCNLIRNDAPYRWRGRYNEDTDLSLRMLKDGLCTVQFHAFLQDKMGTQRLEGGNKRDFYDTEGTLPKSQILTRMHPDVSTLLWRWGRWHHYVDYRQFSGNKLKLWPGIMIPEEPDNLGMVLKQRAKRGKT